jgi:hypothetical protein
MLGAAWGSFPASDPGLGRSQPWSCHGGIEDDSGLRPFGCPAGVLVGAVFPVHASEEDLQRGQAALAKIHKIV